MPDNAGFAFLPLILPMPAKAPQFHTLPRAGACRTSLCLALILLVSACVSPEGIRHGDALLQPAALQAGSLKPDQQASWPEGTWWREFGDAQLDALVTEALAGNPSLKAAETRIRSAQALAESAAAVMQPQGVASASVAKEHLPEHFVYPAPYAGSTAYVGRAGLDFAYEFDFWGKHRAGLDAALSQEQAAKADAAAARLMLEAAVVKAYVRLANLNAANDVACAVEAQRRSRAELAKKRHDAGLDPAMDRRQFDSALLASRAELSQILTAQDLMRHQIAALLGQGPDRGERIDLPRINLPMAAAGLPQVLPADLLGRRPDLAASRWRVEAAARQEDLAKARFYPDVNLSGFVGLASLSLSSLLNLGSRDAAIGPAISLPVFDGGRLRANLKSKAADLDLAIAQYNQSLIDALRDVAEQMTTLRGLLRQQDETRLAVSAAQKAYDLAQRRYEAGLSDRLKVLDAETPLLVQRRLETDLAGRLLEARIELIRALGGGYRATAPQAAPLAANTETKNEKNPKQP